MLIIKILKQQSMPNAVFRQKPECTIALFKDTVTSETIRRGYFESNQTSHRSWDFAVAGVQEP
jgi:hypothetical protein